MPRTTQKRLISGWETTRFEKRVMSERTEFILRALTAPTLAVPTLLLVGIVALALVGCTTTGEPLTQPARAIRVCPEVKAYTAAFQDQLRTEIRSISDSHPATVEAVGDYLGMRDAARKCAEGVTQ